MIFLRLFRIFWRSCELAVELRVGTMYFSHLITIKNIGRGWGLCR